MRWRQRAAQRGPTRRKPSERWSRIRDNSGCFRSTRWLCAVLRAQLHAGSRSVCLVLCLDVYQFPRLAIKHDPRRGVRDVAMTIGIFVARWRGRGRCVLPIRSRRLAPDQFGARPSGSRVIRVGESITRYSSLPQPRSYIPCLNAKEPLAGLAIDPIDTHPTRRMVAADCPWLSPCATSKLAPPASTTLRRVIIGSLRRRAAEMPAVW